MKVFQKILIPICIGTIVWTSISCSKYKHYHSSKCTSLNIQKRCFEREIGRGIESICFIDSLEVKHLLINHFGDTIYNENNGYGIYQKNMYLRVENFMVFFGSLIRDGGGYINTDEQGPVSIAIETTKNCKEVRLVLDMESYSEEYFMYEKD